MNLLPYIYKCPACVLLQGKRLNHDVLEATDNLGSITINNMRPSRDQSVFKMDGNVMLLIKDYPHGILNHTFTFSNISKIGAGLTVRIMNTAEGGMASTDRTVGLRVST